MEIPQRCQEIKGQVELELRAAASEAARGEILVQALYRLADTVLTEMGRPCRSESYQAARGAVLDLIVFLCLPLVRGGGTRGLVSVLAEVSEASEDPVVQMKLSGYARQLLAQAPRVQPTTGGGGSHRAWSPAWGAATCLILAVVLFMTQHPLRKSAVLSRDGGAPPQRAVSASPGHLPPPSAPAWRDAGGGTEAAVKHPPAARPERGEQITRIRVVANQVLVPVTVRNGGEAVRVTLLLDTGSTRTALSEQFAGRLGIDLGRAKGSLVEVADGRVLHAKLATVELLSVGAHTVPSFEMEFYPYSGSDQGFDGFLGMDFLGKQRYQIDVENEVIRWF